MEIELLGKHQAIALHAVKNCPEGYRGIDKIRTGLRLLKKLEKDLPKEGITNFEHEEMLKPHTIKLELVEISMLKTILETQAWNGAALEIVNELFQRIDEAKEEK